MMQCNSKLLSRALLRRCGALSSMLPLNHRANGVKSGCAVSTPLRTASTFHFLSQRVARALPVFAVSSVGMAGSCSKGFLRSAQAGKVGASASLTFATTHHTTLRHYHGGLGAPSRTLLDTKGSNQLQGVSSVDRYRGEEEEEERKDGGGEEEENPFGGKSGPGYLPFPPPFHTINIIMILIIANVLTYFIMMYGSDDTRDFLIDHFTLSRDNWTRIYPIFTNALYQENFLQIAIDCYLLYILGDTILNFLGNARTTFLAALCIAGGGLLHIARQELAVHYGCDELEARGRCYGPNTFIMGLISLEGLIFRHLNFLQQPPVPFLVLTALVMVIDVWRLLNMEVDEHGAATGGALMAYVFWALPTRMLGLDKLTATL